jgi:hypothetical protein
MEEVGKLQNYVCEVEDILDLWVSVQDKILKYEIAFVDETLHPNPDTIPGSKVVMGKLNFQEICKRYFQVFFLLNIYSTDMYLY